MRQALLVSLPLILAAGSFVGADDEKKLSTTSTSPAVVPGSFQAWMVTGRHQGRFHSPICEYGLHPMALVFVRPMPAADQPLVNLLKKLDQSIIKHAGLEPGCCTVVLTDGGFRDAVDKGGEEFGAKFADASVQKEEREGKLQNLAKTQEFAQVVLAIAPPSSLTRFQLDERAEVIVLFCNRQYILQRYSLSSEQLTDDEVNKIASQFEKTLQSIEALGRARKK